MRVNDVVKGTIVFLGVMAGGQFNPYGTGFLVAYLLGIGDALSTIYLVTARHVVEDIQRSGQLGSGLID